MSMHMHMPRQIHSLVARAELNGQVGEVLGDEREGRVPIKVGGTSVRIKPGNLERTGKSEHESKVVDGRVMLYGEWFPIHEFLSTANRCGKPFSSLSKAEQADVMAGRRNVPTGP